MLHLSADSTGIPTWSPGYSTVTRNLLINSYGAGHGIDHDDGSNFWNDVGNVVAFSHACKGNYGSNRNCSANFVVAPGLRTMFGNDVNSAGSGPCAEQSNNGHGSTFANKYFEYNTCVYCGGNVAKAYAFASCSTSKGPSDLDETVWKTAGNTFMVPTGTSVVVPCGGKDIPLAEWQGKYGQDLGATVVELPTTDVLISNAKTVLRVARARAKDSHKEDRGDPAVGGEKAPANITLHS